MSGFHNLTCGECGGELFGVVIEGSPNYPEHLILACVKPSCSGAIVVDVSKPRIAIELHFQEKQEALMPKSNETFEQAVDQLIEVARVAPMERLEDIVEIQRLSNRIKELKVKGAIP